MSITKPKILPMSVWQKSLNIWSGSSIRGLTFGLKKHGGRNSMGLICIRHRGGGHKRKYRFIDFFRNKDMHGPGYLLRIEHDPNRTAFIGLICALSGLFYYILLPESLPIGQPVFNDIGLTATLGSSARISDIPFGSLVNSIELLPGTGAKLARAAGTSALLVRQHSPSYFVLKLPSGEVRLVHKDCIASIGLLSNVYHNQLKLKKAGQTRWLGFRPYSRGIAMNPVDHPHGGRTNGGIPPTTPWGKLAKDRPTRNNKRTSSMIILSQRKIKLKK